MERLTKKKYNSQTKTQYVSESSQEVVEKLGKIEDVLERHKINSVVELERFLI